MRTIILLIASNIFMTFAWYYHLKQEGWPLWKAILLSWLIAFFEYMLMVPANRFGYAKGLSGFQLKMIQEIITLVVFSFFALWYLQRTFSLALPGQFCFFDRGCFFYVHQKIRINNISSGQWLIDYIGGISFDLLPLFLPFDEV